jgi:ribosomal protein S21
MKNNNWNNKPRNNFNKSKPQPRNNIPDIRGASVEVRNGDVNGALRRLKKILENDNRQKDLAKHEYYEKPSIQKKRSRDSAKKRHQRDVRKQLATGAEPFKEVSNFSFMKSKRKRRKYSDAKSLIVQGRRRNS